jgi:membrane protein EpsK
VAIIVAWFAPSLFSIGETAWNDVFILFLLVFGSALIRAWSSNFMQTLFAYNRIDLRNFVGIINITVQVGLIIFLFYFISPSLIWVGTAYFTAALISLLCSIYLSKKIASNLHFNPKLFSRKRLTEIGGIAVWSLIGNVGCALTSSIALIIANVLLGETAASDYSIALTINIGLIAVASLLTTTFTPMIYSYFAKGDTQGLVSFCKLAITSSGLMMALPIGLVCLFAPELLTLWLGQEYIYLIPLLWIVVISTLINVMEAPTSTIGVCYLRVRFQCISALLTGLLSLLLAIILPSYWNLGIYGIAIAIVIGNWLHRCVLCPLYFSWLIDRSYLNFIPTMYKTTLYLMIILIPGGIVLFYVPHTSMWTTIVLGLLICILYILSIPRLVLKKKERMLIRTCIPSFISKIIPHWIF